MVHGQHQSDAYARLRGLIGSFSHFGQSNRVDVSSPERSPYAANPVSQSNSSENAGQSQNVASEVSASETEDHSSEIEGSSFAFEVDMQALYLFLSRHLSDERITLLMYTLLQTNQNFKAFVLSRMDLDTITVPLLRVLYMKDNKSSHHVYMALIVLLILSEDDCYTKSIHEIMLPLDDLEWFREKPLVDCTLGSLVFLILIKTIHANMQKYKDQYLHTNCMSVLGNLSYKLRLLHPYAASRFLKVFQALMKKNSSLSSVDGKEELENLDYAESKVVKHVVKTLFNVMAVALANNLFSNVELIYNVLYHKEAFTEFHEQLRAEVETFDEVNSSNVSALNLLNSTGLIICLELIKFFDQKMGEANQKDNDYLLNSDNFKCHVTCSLKTFPRRFLLSRPLTDLKYNYIQEDNPEDYFIPYIWHLTYKTCRIYWKPECVRLFCL